MTKPILYLLIVSFLFACSETKRSTENELSLPEKISAIFDSIPDFSGVVLLAEEGTPVFFAAFGARNFETTGAIQKNDIFELASVSKQFTAMTIMMLAEDGLLSYGDPIKNYLTDIPYDGITIRQLLNHTSGLPDYQAIMDANWDKSKVANNQDILEYLRKFRPPIEFEPGEKYAYSNTGYVFLASITESVSKKDFVEFCRERIFYPLEMTFTDIRTNESKSQLSNLAHGHISVPEKDRYVRADSFPSSNYTIWLGGRKGPGRVSSTAEDLLKWDQALSSEKLVSQKTLKQAFTPAKLNDGSASNYGFGWIITPDSPLGKVVWHDGDNPGYKTLIVRYLDSNKTLIMLCNNYHGQFERIRERIEQLLSEESVKI
ncbi:MAG: serine hydrolase domain-containing protein [Cyclobacteriaceae bacterium]